MRGLRPDAETTSKARIAYLELPGASHGFDLTDGTRTGAAAIAISLFLTEIDQNQPLNRANKVQQGQRAASQSMPFWGWCM